MNKSVYTRPNKPRFIQVKDRRGEDIDIEALKSGLDAGQPLEVHASTECHITPHAVAARMVDYLDISDSHSILEPHAGTGALLSALLDAKANVSQMHAVERDYSLVSHLRKHTRFEGINITHDCFLQYADFEDKRFDRIVLNPPFKYIRAHMKAAISLLRKGGEFVALVPVTYHHDSAVELERLSNDTFISTTVNTKIIRINS